MADHKTHALVEGITSLLRAATTLEHAPEHKAAKEATVLNLTRALEAANQLHVSPGELGACRFPSNGSTQCANLTSVQCSMIVGSSFSPGLLCPISNGGSTSAKPAPAGSAL
jgi:hypothetical protein